MHALRIRFLEEVQATQKSIDELGDTIRQRNIDAETLNKRTEGKKDYENFANVCDLRIQGLAQDIIYVKQDNS